MVGKFCDGIAPTIFEFDGHLTIDFGAITDDIPVWEFIFDVERLSDHDPGKDEYIYMHKYYIAIPSNSYPEDPSSPLTSTPSNRTAGEKKNLKSAATRNGKRKSVPNAVKPMKKTRATPNDMDMDTSSQELADPVPKDPFARLQAFMKAEFAATNENIAKINATVSKMREKVGINTRNLARLKLTVEAQHDGTEAEIKKLNEKVAELERRSKKEVDDLRKAVEEIKENRGVDANCKVVAEMKDSIRELKELPASNQNTSIIAPKCNEQYLKARRSLRLWPVRSGAGSELMDNTINFIHEKLRVPTSDVSGNDIERIARVASRKKRNPNSARAGDAVDEVVVLFSSAERRDLVMSHAYNLAPFVDENRKPTAGVRLEIPEYLTGAFQDLQNYGRSLHETHGRGFKRNVKFDDADQCLYMVVKLPDSDQWLYVDREMARDNRKANIKKNVNLTKEKLQAATVGSSHKPKSGSDNVVMTKEDDVQILPGPSGLPARTSKTLVKFGGRMERRETDWE